MGFALMQNAIYKAIPNQQHSRTLLSVGPFLFSPAFFHIRRLLWKPNTVERVIDPLVELFLPFFCGFRFLAS